ncbi:MAG: transcriptional regulator [Qipengyuania sp.]
MNACEPASSRQLAAVFPETARARFAENYPEDPHRLGHLLRDDSRFSLDALAALAERLPKSSIEYNRGDLPIGVDGKPDPTGIPIGETIRRVASSNSWAVLKNIEQVTEYRTLILELLGELGAEIESKTGEFLTPQGFVFISSPNAVTPYHFDPEHNILLQLVGSKTMTQFPAGHPHFAPDKVHESYHLGGPRELAWRDEMESGGRSFALQAGDAVYVPVMAPHFVRNGPESSISLSITWRSAWSYEESEARCFNGIIRRWGFAPHAPQRWPARNAAKSLAFRAYRRLFGIPTVS